jgi:hypothetical protein
MAVIAAVLEAQRDRIVGQVQVVGDGRVYACARARKNLLDRLGQRVLVGKTFDHELAVDDGHRGHVLQAELALEARADQRAVEVALVAQPDLDLSDIDGQHVVFQHEPQRRLVRLVHEVASRVHLDPNARRHDVERVTRPSVTLDWSYGIPRKNTSKKPLPGSKQRSLAVKPSAASVAATTPLRAAFPAWNGLVIVPLCPSTPPVSEVAMPQAMAIRRWSSPSNLAQAAAAPKPPKMAVGCQPTRPLTALLSLPMTSYAAN